jgi:hypothetical protein
MKILKTTALATILALGSLSANATYDGVETFTIEVVTSAALTALLDDVTPIFSNIVDGDTISATIDLTITGTTTAGNDTARAITCALSGTGVANGTNIASTGSQVTLYTDGDSSAAALAQTIDVTLGTCTQTTGGTVNTMTLASSAAISGSAAGTSYETSGSLTVTVAYVALSDIATYT